MSSHTLDLQLNLQEFQTKASSLGIKPDESTLKLLAEFCTQLAAYNEHTNLVSCAEPSIVLTEHILDAWSLIPILQEIDGTGSLRLIDIGSGAGFPGIILAIACPWLSVTLVESVGKKCKFLSQVSNSLDLGSRVQILNGRAEDLGHHKKWRAQFDFATARAVGSTDVIAELAIPFIKPGGYLLAQKSAGQLEQESRLAHNILPILGGQLDKVVSLNQEILGKSLIILIIKKIKPTSARYPRSAAEIKHHPLSKMKNTT